jgi:hypothetical protein
MRALVVYESMYGNTHAIAIAIAAGLRDRHDVTVVPVSRATRELVASAGLIVAGGPTHVHGMSSAASRRSAAQAAGKQGSDLDLDPDAGGPGLRGWLRDLSAGAALAVAFDTRLSGIPMVTGRASRGISRALKRQGLRLVAEPESFLVTKQNALLDGEAERARAWGTRIGAAASALLAHA